MERHGWMLIPTSHSLLAQCFVGTLLFLLAMATNPLYE